MRFGNPHLLWLLLVLPPVLAFFLWWASRQRRKLLARFVQTRLLSALTVGISPARRKIRSGCLILAVALLIVALARPQYGFNLQKVEQRGLDIVVAIDTSKSMLAEDIPPNRLERAKLAALDLMQQAKPDRLGLVAFAGDAFLECPLTFDNTAFQQCVQALNVNTLPQGGTAIAEAIQTAQTAFKQSDHYKVLVLFTDGGDNGGGALSAAKAAAKAGLRIFTVGIGTAKGDLLRVTDANGNSHYLHDAKGDVVKSRLNETLLRQIATATGGFYLPLRGANAMETLYKRGLSVLPKSEGEERLIRRYHEQYHWPLAAAILLLLVEMFLPERRSPARRDEVKTSNVQHSKSPPSSAGAAILIAFVALPLVAKASPASALKEYNSGDFTNAMQEFDRLAQIHTNDLRLIFNAGAAAYRATNYDQALSDFQTAALSPDVNLQEKAFYNMGNTLYRQGETAFEPSTEGLEAMEEHWRQAVKSYEHAVELDTNDTDAVYNLGFVKKQIALITQLREVMRKAKQAADEAVRRNEYHRALEIMESLNNPIAAKRFKDYITRLKNINAIVTPHQH